MSRSGTAATSEAPAAVSVRNLRMGYGTLVLLDDASFDVRRGEIVVVLGGSGCGKSSLMKNIIGLYEPMAGDIRIAGKSIVSASSGDKARLQRSLGVMAGDAAREGPSAFFMLMSMVSLNLALFNLLPIPILDGGNLLLLAMEGIRRRDFSLAFKERFVQVGLVFLLALLAFVMYNDVVRLLPLHS